MKTTLRLTIDLEVRTSRRWLFFWNRMYVKATYEGEMDVGKIRVGEIISLRIFGDRLTPLVVRGIQKIPVPGSSENLNLIEMYHRTESFEETGIGLRPHTLAECVNRLDAGIAQRLATYKLALDPKKSKVGPKPTYEYIPSNVGGTYYTLASLSLR